MFLAKSLLSLMLTISFTLDLNDKAEEHRQEKIKVACLGDSITFGARLDNPSEDSYPAQLQKLLGNEYQVTNFGVGGSTLLRKGKPNVWSQLSKVEAFEPDAIVISLGTNDTCGMGTCGNRKCWEYQNEYASDYADLIDLLQALPSKPELWICAPSPMVLETPGLSDERIEGLTIRKPRLQQLIARVKVLAEDKHVNFIDLNTPLDHKPELFTEKDGVHPNKEGYRAIAQLVYDHISK